MELEFDFDDPSTYYNTCAVCGVLLDSADDNVFTCSDVRCERTWEDRVDTAYEHRCERIALEEENQ